MENMKINARMGLLVFFQIVVVAGVAMASQMEQDSYLLPILLIGGLVLIILTLLIGRSVSAPLARLNQAADDWAQGKISELPRTNAEGDLGQLENHMAALSATTSKLKTDLAALNKKQAAGDMEALLEDKGYAGEYKDIVKDINAVIKGYNQDIALMLEHTRRFGQGDFTASMQTLPGKKVKYSQDINQLQEVLKAFAADLKASVSNYMEGKASSYTAASSKNGEWAYLMREVNSLQEMYAKPIKEASDVLNRMASGDWSQVVVGEFKGEFAALKQAINSLSIQMNGHIKEIAATLNDLSAVGAQRSRRDYAGPFLSIKDAIRSVEQRISHLEKQQAEKQGSPSVRPIPGLKAAPATSTPTVGRTAVAPTAPPARTGGTAATPPLKEGGFKSAVPIISSRTMTAPNASHIYDSKDFGKYK
jgi:methyl-accepting chemotaxis protein